MVYAITGASPDVAPISSTANIQCSNNAAAGLCSRGSSCGSGPFRGCNHVPSLATGVVVLLAKKCENGKTPSLAISCFTVGRCQPRFHYTILCEPPGPYLDKL